MSSALFSWIQTALGRMVVRGIVTSVNHAGFRYQQIEARGLASLAVPDMDHMQPGGFAHRPKITASTQVLMLEVGGASDHVVALCVADPLQRPTDMDEGESVMFSASHVAVRAKDSGDVTVETPAGVAINITAAGAISITGAGAVDIGGSTLALTGSGVATVDGIVVKTHTHPVPGGPPT